MRDFVITIGNTTYHEESFYIDRNWRKLFNKNHNGESLLTKKS
jgi:hypothetical protein